MNTLSNKDLLNFITKANTFAIITHKNPDGDALSSCLAIFWYLKSIGKDVEKIDIIIPEYNNDFNFLPGFKFIKKENTFTHYDLLLVVDVSTTIRVNPKKILNIASDIIIIDHHDSINDLFSDKTIINTSLPSCTNIIYNLFKDFNEYNFLYCIATGIISDTSNLTLNTNKDTINLVNKLKKDCININSIIDNLFKPNERISKLFNTLKERIKIINYKNHKILYSYLLQNDLNDNEKSLVNLNHKLLIFYLKQTFPNIKTFILILENNKYELKYSMRTFDDTIDLTKVTSFLLRNNYIIKGGGHTYSASCTFKSNNINNNIENVNHNLNYILDNLKEQLN